MDTLPVPLGSSGLSAGPSAGSLEEFRVSAPAEMQGLLKELMDGNVLVTLSTPEGLSYTTTVWSIDPARGILSLSADAGDQRMADLVDAEEVVAVGYLYSVKLQFDLQGLTLVHGHGASVLNTPMPREMFRFQRRSCFRVRPVGNAAASARLRHPAIPDMQLLVRVVDVSLGGVALFVPDNMPAVHPGLLLNTVQLELDTDTHITVNLRVHHVSAINQQSRGLRLGCEMVNLSGEGTRALQRYIDGTQKRRRLLAL
jgi:c-di-GMP-binding flagellar brake protein YcgR